MSKKDKSNKTDKYDGYKSYADEERDIRRGLRESAKNDWVYKKYRKGK